MFTGLIEAVGDVCWLRRTMEGTELSVAAPKFADELAIGESLAVNGCCLTLARSKKGVLTFDLLEETLRRTNLGDLRPDMKVNFERSLPVGGRLGGHFVQGHVDDVARVRSAEMRGKDLRLEIELSSAYARYIAFKGSISVNGVSLTVAELGDDFFAVWIIPHTRLHTNLHELRPGSLVNLEFDILAKYVGRLQETARE